MKKLISFLIAALTISSAFSQPAQWNGPNRNGIFPEKGLLKKWPEGGPKMILKIEGIGRGYSQHVAQSNTIYVTGIKKDTMDVLSAYDMKGKLLWETSYGNSWNGTYPDTRSTPTIENGRIYLISGMGEMVCLDQKTGKIMWKQNPYKTYKGKSRAWGIAESVLIAGKVAVSVIGGPETTVVAYDKITGKLAWKTKSLGGTRAYSSSIYIERGGQKLIISQASEYLMGIDPSNGNFVWTYKTIDHFKGNTDMGRGDFTASPLYSDGNIYITAGYTMAGVKLKLAEDGKSVSFVWENETLNPHHGGFVLVNGNLYGSTWKTNSLGSWTSVSWETGKTNWFTTWNNKGSIIAAEGLMYIYEEKNGNFALVQPDPTGLKIISSFRITSGTGMHFAHPAIYNGNLYVRHGNALMIYSIKAV
jgi:outer membrane protein assembly factor BamB